MKKTIAFISLALMSLLALPVFAASPKDFKELINNVFINGIFRPLVPFLIGLAVIVFIYGVLLLMLSEGGEKKEEGKQFMIWGIVGIFVMVSVWGLVYILRDTFKLNPAVPQIEINLH